MPTTSRPMKSKTEKKPTTAKTTEKAQTKAPIKPKAAPAKAAPAKPKPQEKKKAGGSIVTDMTKLAVPFGLIAAKQTLEKFIQNRERELKKFKNK